MPYGYDPYQPRKPPSYGPKDPEHETYRKLFIGGLSYETTDETLKKHFEQWGQVVDCIIMKDPTTKRSRGFGFITYKEAGMVDEAQGKRPHKIDGREVESKRAMPREESGNPDSQMSVNKMFIGGVKDDTTEEQVREVFKEFGKIENVNLITDKTTGKLKGFAFVEFDDYDCVDKAVLRKRHSLNGKDVEVKKAQNKDQPMAMGRGGRGMRGGRGGGGGGGRGGYGGYGGGYGDGYNDGYGPGGYGGYNQGYGGGGGGGGNWGGHGGGYDGYGGPYGNQGGWGGGPPYGSGYGDNYGSGHMKGGNYSHRSGSYEGGYNSGGYGSGGRGGYGKNY